LCASPDGKYALSCSRDIHTRPTIKVWDLQSGACLRTMTGPRDNIDRASLSADGRFVLTTGHAELTIWDVEDGKSIFTLGGHTAWIKTACFSQNGRYVLSGSHDKTLKFWQLDWDLEEKETVGWNEGALPYLDIFLTLHSPYAGSLPQDRTPTEEEITLALTRRGKPAWTEEDFQQLLYTLGCAGYGWLRPEGVRRKLEEIAKER
jgi:WD40 repeat protein